MSRFFDLLRFIEERWKKWLVGSEIFLEHVQFLLEAGQDDEYPCNLTKPNLVLITLCFLLGKHGKSKCIRSFREK